MMLSGLGRLEIGCIGNHFHNLAVGDDLVKCLVDRVGPQGLRPFYSALSGRNRFYTKRTPHLISAANSFSKET